MNDYALREDTVEIPPGAGVEGFLHALKQVLKLPRVTDIHIDARGVVKYSHWVRETEEVGFQLTVDFDELCPYKIIRNSVVVDLGYAGEGSPLGHIARMFERAELDHMHCVSFVTGAASSVRSWFRDCAQMKVVNQLMGLPLLTDRFLEDDTLILCTAFGRGAEMKDVRMSYRITVPKEGSNADAC